LRLPASIHKQPLKGGGNVHLRQLAEAFLAEQLPDRHPRAVAPRVRAAIQQTLGAAPTNITTVAAVLSMHPRTLQRRLVDEKTSFATILDDVRRNAARRYLTGTDKVGQAGLEDKARPPNDGVKLIAAASSVENALEERIPLVNPAREGT
jgi:AraC-like DNA-binding protein